MRGVPNHPVTCKICGRPRGAPKDELCHGCRIKHRANSKKKYFWTAELDLSLTRAYRFARDRAELTQLLNHLQRSISFPRFAILARAAELGLAFQVRRRWTAPEVEAMRELLGTCSIKTVALKLGRTYQSVKRKVAVMRLSSRICEGYSLKDIQELIGVNSRKVYGWICKGWLRLDSGRASDVEMRRFLRLHPEEYILRRVDEAWFKDIMFSKGNNSWIQGREASTRIGDSCDQTQA
jgi:hypothetical protein